MTAASLQSLGSATGTFPISLGGGRVLADPADGLRFLSEPWPSGSKVKEAIERASRRVRIYCDSFHYWRAFDVWYRKARSVEAYEIDAIAQAIAAKEKKELRDEFADILSRISILESRLVTQDPDFHRPSIGGLREMARQAGRKDRA
jgi:hypothetical protein